MADAQRPVEVAETTEAQIAVHWKEEEYYSPPASFVAQAHLKDPAINERFAEQNFHLGNQTLRLRECESPRHVLHRVV